MNEQRKAPADPYRARGFWVKKQADSPALKSVESEVQIHITDGRGWFPRLWIPPAFCSLIIRKKILTVWKAGEKDKPSLNSCWYTTDCYFSPLKMRPGSADTVIQALANRQIILNHEGSFCLTKRPLDYTEAPSLNLNQAIDPVCTIHWLPLHWYWQIRD